jgi:hypothetical protein
MASFHDNVRRQDTSAPVTLVVGVETVTLQPDQYAGQSVNELFAAYGHRLVGEGRVDRITEYQLNGEIVPGSTQPRPGETVRGVVTVDGKG